MKTEKMTENDENLFSAIFERRSTEENAQRLTFNTHSHNQWVQNKHLKRGYRAIKRYM